MKKEGEEVTVTQEPLRVWEAAPNLFSQSSEGPRQILSVLCCVNLPYLHL